MCTVTEQQVAMGELELAFELTIFMLDLACQKSHAKTHFGTLKLINLLLQNF